MVNPAVLGDRTVNPTVLGGRAADHSLSQSLEGGDGTVNPNVLGGKAVEYWQTRISSRCSKTHELRKPQSCTSLEYPLSAHSLGHPHTIHYVASKIGRNTHMETVIRFSIRSM